jgi:catechol 2,3-dioxygenase-like lactoylglutathione lyase family enzyme/predicted enzyme related to lactoylglutathione lyase
MEQTNRLGVSRFALVLALAATSIFAQPASRPSDIVGLAFVGHQVADLERSINFFEAIDFKVIEGPSAWTVDKELNKLVNTPGAESRTAIMQVQSSVSDVPFTLVLRQYRGNRQDWSKLNSWDLLDSHIDLTVDGSVSDLLDKLEAKNLLKMPEMQGLQNPRHQNGFRRYAFIQDPDGLTIEYFGKPIPKPGDPPARPTVSNSSATPQNIDRLGKQAGFNHFAVNVMDPVKARDFYMKVLGGDYPPIENLSSPQIMQNGWYPQAATNNNLRVELVYFAMNKGKTAPPIKFNDINANCSGFQVSNIQTAYARAKANGAVTVSDGGIIKYHGGRAVMIRDSDVGGYIMLWQPGSPKRE